MKRISSYILSLILACAFLTSCSTTRGGFGEQTHFDYPNSNVKPLGHVSATVKKTGFFFPPSWGAEDVKTLIERALSQKPGADILINYKTNTTFTSWVILPIYSSEMVLEGTAVSMTIGRQELQEQFNDSKY